MNSTCISNIQLNSTLHTHVPNQLEHIIRHIYMIGYPIILIIGLIGNLLSSLLFSATELSQTSCAIYFLILSIADSVALLGGLHHCLVIGYHILISNVIYCRVRNFLVYTSMDLASWIVVAISVDRFYKVKYPLQARIYCTQKLTIIVSCIITTVLILKNIHLSTSFIGNFSENNTSDKCGTNPNYPGYVSFFSNIWPWIDLATFALLPFIFISFCNSYIIYNQYRRRLKFGYRNLDRSLTKFLLISAILFVLCNFPVSISIVLYPYLSDNYTHKDHYDTAKFIFDILRLPSYVSLALNFYLYYYSCSIFRQQAVLLLKRIFRIPIKSDQIHISSSRIDRTQFTIQINSNEETEK